MKTHSLIQGSAEWLQYRSSHFNASDAAAMMGCSAYKTRSQLLHERHTGLSAEVDSATQRRFDDGHRFEALARPLAEEIIGTELYPVTGSVGRLSASFDGLTMDESICFEHKTLNAELRSVMAEGNTGVSLPLMYRVQMEQQMLVSGAEKCLFMASKWQGEELVEECHTWYSLDAKLSAEILQGWTQFAIDLAAYVPTEAAPAVVAAAITALPAVSVQVSGSISIKDNFAAFEVALKDFIEHRLIRKPETDQDFADLDTQIKALKGAESALDALEAQMLSQVEAVDLAKRTKDMLLKMARENRLMAEKLLTARKDQIKVEQVQRGQKALAEHIAALNARLGKPFMPAVNADFAGAIKGLRTIDSLQNAIDTLLASVKISSSATADLIQTNLATLQELASTHKFLFSDEATIVLKANDDLTALVKTRIAEHQAAELAKEEATRERIRAEVEQQERAKAEHNARVQAEKVAAEFAAQQNAPQIIQEIIPVAPTPPAANVVPMRAVAPVSAPTPATPPTMKLGDINAHLSPITLTADGLTKLGFPPAATDKNAKLYHADDLTRICGALHELLDRVQAKQAA